MHTTRTADVRRDTPPQVTALSPRQDHPNGSPEGLRETHQGGDKFLAFFGTVDGC